MYCKVKEKKKKNYVEERDDIKIKKADYHKVKRRDSRSRVKTTNLNEMRREREMHSSVVISHLDFMYRIYFSKRAKRAKE